MFRTAVYPGSFDPPTLGHLDMIERAAGIFDRLTVAIGVNSHKRSLLSRDERLAALEGMCAHLPNVDVAAFEGLLVEFVRSRDSRCVVRGLRATTDFEYEFQMALVNRRLAGEIETVFLMTSPAHSYLSSSLVREVATLKGDVSGMVPGAVAPILEAAAARRRAEPGPKPG